MAHWFNRNLRITLLVLVGGVSVYQFARYRGLIPSMAQLRAVAGPPIVCPIKPQLHTPPPGSGFLAQNQTLANLIADNFDQQQISLLIEKGKHRLTIYYAGKPIKSYPVVFGRGQGDKRREGDLKTPEGILKIRDKYPHPDWSKFLWLDYPNAESECKHNRAKQRGEIPLWSTIGGEVGIHGVPQQHNVWITSRQNWTWGCPAMRNPDIDELYPYVQVGTIVEIVA